MCGKSGWIYDVDSSGTILSKSLNSLPEDINKFHSSIVSNNIKEKYFQIINQ
jgi:hypothetical protein